MDLSEVHVGGRIEVLAVSQIYCCGEQTVLIEFNDGETLHVCQSALFPYCDEMIEQIGTA